MAKTKNVTRDEVVNAVENLRDAVGPIQALTRRYENTVGEAIADGLEFASSLNAAASVCIDLSNQLIALQRLSDMRRETEEKIRKEVAEDRRPTP